MTQLTFVRVPGDQDSDPSFEMRAPDGRWTGISIQDPLPLAAATS